MSFVRVTVRICRIQEMSEMPHFFHVFSTFFQLFFNFFTVLVSFSSFSCFLAMVSFHGLFKVLVSETPTVETDGERRWKEVKKGEQKVSKKVPIHCKPASNGIPFITNFVNICSTFSNLFNFVNICSTFCNKSDLKRVRILANLGGKNSCFCPLKWHF